MPPAPQGPITALCWGPHGYQLLVAERGEAAAGPRLCEQDFARFMPGQHRVAAQAQLPLAQQLGFEGQLATLRAAQHGVHALQVRAPCCRGWEQRPPCCAA